MKSRKLFLFSLYSVILLALGVFFSNKLSIPDTIKAKDNNYTLNKESQKSNNGHSHFAIIAKKAMPAVVSIRVERSVEYRSNSPFQGFMGSPFQQFFGNGQNFEKQQKSQKHIVKNLGSGFIYTQDGYIMTNNHVVEGADKIIVKRYNGEELTAQVIGKDPETDLAVIKVDAKFTPEEILSFGNSDDLWVGDYAIAIGSPYSLEKTVTVGVISAKGRSGLGIAGGGPSFQDFIQTDAAINPGNSGGPLLNINGKVIGMNAAVNSAAQGIGFAIPSDFIKKIEQMLKDNGEIKRGYVGIQLKEISAKEKEIFGLDKNQKGILISKVEKTTPAEEGGLKGDDIIIKLNSKNILSFEKFRFAVAGFAPGDKIELTILREGNEKNITIKLGDRSEYLHLATAKNPTITNETTLGMTVSNITNIIKNQYKLENNDGVFVKSISEKSKVFGKIQARDIIVKIIFNAKHYKINKVSDLKNALKRAEKHRSNFLIKFIRNGNIETTVINFKLL